MATISILANTVRQSVDRRLDDTAFEPEKVSWQDPVHSWKAGPVEVMTVKSLFILSNGEIVMLCLFLLLFSFLTP